MMVPPDPTGRFLFRPMRREDLDQILQIEQEAFSTPWSRDHFLHEMESNPFSWNVVLVAPEGAVLAYACNWILDNELQINDIAVHQEWRRAGLASKLLELMLGGAAEKGCIAASLEVRPSNRTAMNLYSKFGFQPVGRRKQYYRDTGEDALILEKKI